MSIEKEEILIFDIKRYISLEKLKIMSNISLLDKRGIKMDIHMQQALKKVQDWYAKASDWQKDLFSS